MRIALIDEASGEMGYEGQLYIDAYQQGYNVRPQECEESDGFYISRPINDMVGMVYRYDGDEKAFFSELKERGEVTMPGDCFIAAKFTRPNPF